MPKRLRFGDFLLPMREITGLLCNPPGPRTPAHGLTQGNLFCSYLLNIRLCIIMKLYYGTRH